VKRRWYLVVQDLILLLQARHEGVFGQISGPGAVLGVGAADLLVERLDVGGNEAMQLEELTLFLCEGRSPVEVWASEECIALVCSVSDMPQVRCVESRPCTVKVVS
jgi:hypothetical protein